MAEVTGSEEDTITWKTLSPCFRPELSKSILRNEYHDLLGEKTL
jgi:hypothetical protein